MLTTRHQNVEIVAEIPNQKRAFFQNFPLSDFVIKISYLIRQQNHTHNEEYDANS